MLAVISQYKSPDLNSDGRGGGFHRDFVMIPLLTCGNGYYQGNYDNNVNKGIIILK